MNALFRCSCLALTLVCVAIASASTAGTPELRAFTAKSFAEIKQAHAGRAFILAFWSVTCEPCREETMVISELHRKYPNVPIILVASDGPPSRPDVIRFLRNYQLGQIQTWQFADDSAERLRYSIDKTWAGELPRSYFFDARHELTAHSGVVDARWLQTWLERENRTATKRG